MEEESVLHHWMTDSTADNEFQNGLWQAIQEAFESVGRKLQLFAIGLLHLLFSSDKRWTQAHAALEDQYKKTDSTVITPVVIPADSQEDLCAAEQEPRAGAPTPRHHAPQPRNSQSKCTKHKRIVFIRHAESEWNVVFNRGFRITAIFHFVRAVLREMLLLPTSDSIFLDSPLSHYGHQQAKALFAHVSQRSYPQEVVRMDAPEHLLAYLCSPLPNSVVVTSNLRRAIDTARIASASRLELPGERIHVLSCLQEIGRNVDTLALCDAYEIQPEILSKALRLGKRQDELFNLSESHGNKSVRGCGKQRLMTFVKWAMCRQEGVLVVYGHSQWFRSFCQEFFPTDMYHEAKERKIRNCGVVSFVLQERRSVTEHGGSHIDYRIDPDSFHCLR